MTNRDIASIGFCGLLLGTGCVMNDAEPQGRSGVPWKALVPIKTLMERDGLEPLLRDWVKETVNPQGSTSRTVVVPAKDLRQDERQAPQANATLRQDGYTFRTNDAGEAIILEFEKGYSGALAITNRLGGCRVSVDVSSVPDVNDEDRELGVTDFVDNTIVAHANAPRFTSAQFLDAGRTRIYSKSVHCGDQAILKTCWEGAKGFLC